MITLKKVDETSYEACSELMCKKEQCAFTNSPAWTMIQAAYAPFRNDVSLQAILSGDTVVGMVRLDYTEEDCYMFTNLLIDQDYQRQGFAYSAVTQIISLFAADGRHDTIKIHVAEDNKAAIALYQKAGFVFTRELVNDGLCCMEYALMKG